MLIFDYFVELCCRLIYLMVVVVVGFLVLWIWCNEIFQFIFELFKVVVFIVEMVQIYYKDLIEFFFMLIKILLMVGVFLGLFVILWQVWKFIVLGLYVYECKLVILFVVLVMLFFLGGVSFCYYFVMSYGFVFLFKFSDEVLSLMFMM